ncbi:MAG: RNA methyltransferase, partial [Planctomycetota bacterium]
MASKRGKMPDSAEYLAKRAHFRSLLTIYGRKTVLDALLQDDLECVRLHIALGARGRVIQDILSRAETRGIPIRRATEEEVTRISRNGRQDQGVAADLKLPAYGEAETFLKNAPKAFALLALNGITTPRNVGMIIRSVAAGGLDGVVLPEQGSARIDSLVIKASAGAVFRTRILRCERLETALGAFREAQSAIAVLDAHGALSLFEYSPPGRVVYVLGNEADGVSRSIRALETHTIRIP